MQFSLLTYDCTLALNAGYSGSRNAIEFSKTLLRLVTQFSAYSGVHHKDISWIEVTNSDWCKNTLLLYGRVPADWQPRTDTEVWDGEFDPSWHSNLATGFWQWMRGGGQFVNILQTPPVTPHQLFKTIQRG